MLLMLVVVMLPLVTREVADSTAAAIPAVAAVAVSYCYCSWVTTTFSASVT
jgi:hypothetical protein